MRLIDVDEAKEQIKQMQTLKASERVLFQLALDRTPTYKPPNDPLTLEELREMDGEPVWVKRQEGYGSGWALVRVWCKSDNIIYLVQNNGSNLYPQVEIDCGGKIYRRKPEEETSNA